jgi:hypothetical protein
MKQIFYSRSLSLPTTSLMRLHSERVRLLSNQQVTRSQTDSSKACIFDDIYIRGIVRIGRKKSIYNVPPWLKQAFYNIVWEIRLVLRFSSLADLSLWRSWLSVRRILFVFISQSMQFLHPQMHFMAASISNQRDDYGFQHPEKEVKIHNLLAWQQFCISILCGREPSSTVAEVLENVALEKPAMCAFTGKGGRLDFFRMCRLVSVQQM